MERRKDENERGVEMKVHGNVVLLHIRWYASPYTNTLELRHATPR
jgi:hypothetical protein